MENNLSCLAALRGQSSSTYELVLFSSSSIRAESLCFAAVFFVQVLGELVWQRTARNNNLGVPMRVVEAVTEGKHALSTGASEVILALERGDGVGRGFAALCRSS